MTQSFLEATRKSFGENVSYHAITQGECLSGSIDGWEWLGELDQIPEPLLSWIKSQDGLRIDRKLISSKEELVLAYQFLSPLDEDIRDKSLTQIALKVATMYISKVKKERRLSVQDLMFPATEPYNIIQRKCSKCDRRVLDDAFACFAVADAKKYVVWYRMNSCGRPDCRVDGQAILVPLSPHQEYRMARHKDLLCLRTAAWERHLVRCLPQELSGLPKQVATTCEACKKQDCFDTRPRWTSENSSRYVVRVQSCSNCKKQFSSFIPIDSSIPTISKCALSKKWDNLVAAGINADEYPRCPNILWSHKQHKTKLRELIAAKKRAIADDNDEQPTQSVKLRRVFTSKSLENYDLVRCDCIRIAFFATTGPY